ncbi:hypothetical protein M3J09_004756 [Ascochyta lentis]
MAETLAGTKRRRVGDQYGEPGVVSPDIETSDASKRRAFLRTMGQQLREFGTEGVSPQDQSRHTFFSPGCRPTARAHDPTSAQDAAQADDVSENDVVPGENDQLPAGAVHSAARWLWRADEVRPDNPGESTSLFAFEDLLDWSQSYFDHWHPSFPFLHAPALLDYFRELAQTGMTFSAAASAPQVLQHVILRSVMSIAAMDRRQLMQTSKPLPSTLTFHSFNEAISSVQVVLTEESSIMSLQALVSVQLFLISMHRYNAASQLQGIAAHLVFQLGLHRCPNRTLLPLRKKSELRKRMFWSVFCLDRYISIRLGTPSVISSNDVDVCYPQTERHVHIDSTNREHDDRLDLLDFLAKHAEIRGSIMELRNRTALKHDCQDDGQALTVETEHAKWWTTVDEYLSDDQHVQNIIKPHQITLIVLRFETVLALHRSILGNPKHDTVFNAALQRCITASRSIVNTLHKALKGFGAFDGSPGQRGYESTPLLWPSFTWAVWMSSFVIVFAAIEKQLSHKIAFGLIDRSVEVLQHIALRGTSWPESCIVAIKNLTARLKRSCDHDFGAARSETIGGGSSRASEVNAPAQSAQSPTQQHLSSTNCEVSRHVTTNTTASSRLPGASDAPTASHVFDTNDAYRFGAAAGDAANRNPVLAADNYLSGPADFLGIAQQSSDIPRPLEDITQLFSSEDMTWWMNADLGLEGVL